MRTTTVKTVPRAVVGQVDRSHSLSFVIPSTDKSDPKDCNPSDRIYPLNGRVANDRECNHRGRRPNGRWLPASVDRPRCRNPIANPQSIRKAARKICEDTTRAQIFLLESYAIGAT